MQYRAHLPPRWSDTAGTSMSPLRPYIDFYFDRFSVTAAGDIVTPTKTYRNVSFLFEYIPSIAIDDPPDVFLKTLTEEDFGIPELENKIWAAHPITFYGSGWFIKGVHKLPSFNGMDVFFSTVPFRKEGKPWWGDYYDPAMRPYYNPPPEWAFAEDARSYLYTGNPNDPRVLCPALIHSHAFDNLRYFIRFFDTVYIFKPTEYARRRFYRLVEDELPSIMRVLQGLSWLEEVPAPDELKNVPITKSGVFLDISLGESLYFSYQVLEGVGSPPEGFPILPTPSFYPAFLQSATQKEFLESAKWKYSPNAGFPYITQPTWWDVDNFKVGAVGISLIGLMVNPDINYPWGSENQWLENLLTMGGQNKTFARYTTGYYDGQGNWIMPPFIDVPAPLLVWYGTSGSFIIGSPETVEVPATNHLKVFVRGMQEYSGEWGNIRYKHIRILTTQVRLSFVSFSAIAENAKVYAPPNPQFLAKLMHPYFELESVFTFPFTKYMEKRKRRAQFKPRDYIRHVDYLNSPKDFTGASGNEYITGATFAYSTLPTGETSNVHISGEDVPTVDSFIDIISAEWQRVDLDRTTRQWLENHLTLGFNYAVAKIKEYFRGNRFVHSLMPKSDVTCWSIKTVAAPPNKDFPVTVTSEKELVRLSRYMKEVGTIYRSALPEEDENYCKIKRYINALIPIGVYTAAPDYEGSVPKFLETVKAKSDDAIVTDYPITYSPKIVNWTGAAVSPPELQYIPLYLVRERPQMALMYDFIGKSASVRIEKETRWLFLKEEPVFDDKEKEKGFYFRLMTNLVLRPIVYTDFALFEWNVQAQSYTLKRYTQPIIVGTPANAELYMAATDTRAGARFSIQAQTASGDTVSPAMTVIHAPLPQSWLVPLTVQMHLFDKNRQTELLNLQSYAEYLAFWDSVTAGAATEIAAKTTIQPPEGMSFYDYIKFLVMKYYNGVCRSVPLFLFRLPVANLGWLTIPSSTIATTTDDLRYFIPPPEEIYIVRSQPSPMYPNINYPDDSVTTEVYIKSGGKTTKLVLTPKTNQLIFFVGEEMSFADYLETAPIPIGAYPYRRRAQFRVKKNLISGEIEYTQRPDIGFSLCSYFSYAPIVPPTITQTCIPSPYFPSVSMARRLFSDVYPSGITFQVGSSTAVAPKSVTYLVTKRKPSEVYSVTSMGDGLNLIQTFGVPPHQRDRDNSYAKDPLWGTIVFDMNEWILQPLPIQMFRCYDIPILGARRSFKSDSAILVSVTDEYLFKGDTKMCTVNYSWVAEDIVDSRRAPIEDLPVVIRWVKDNGEETDTLIYHPRDGSSEEWAYYDNIYTTWDGYKIGYFRRVSAESIEPVEDGNINRGWYPQMSLSWEEIWLGSGFKTENNKTYLVHRLRSDHQFHYKVYLTVALPERKMPNATIVSVNRRCALYSTVEDSFYDICMVRGINPLIEKGGWFETHDSDTLSLLAKYEAELKSKLNLDIGRKLLAGVDAATELQDTVTKGLKSLETLARFFPAIPPTLPKEEIAKIAKEESLDDEEKERMDDLVKATATVWECPQYSVFALYYTWVGDDAAEKDWLDGKPIGVKKRAPAALIIRPKYPTLSFPFILDSAEEVRKIHGIVRTPPINPSPPSNRRYPYTDLYLHYLRTELYRQTSSEDLCPKFDPVTFIPAWAYDYLTNAAEYSAVKEDAVNLQKMVSIRWSELNTTVFVYPHIPNWYELEFQVAPAQYTFLRHYGMPSLFGIPPSDFTIPTGSKYTDALASAVIFTDLYTLWKLAKGGGSSELSGIYFTRGREVPIHKGAQPKTDIELRVPEPAPCSGHAFPYNTLLKFGSLVIHNPHLDKKPTVTLGGKVKSGVPITIRWRAEKMADYRYSYGVWGGVQIEVPYSAAPIDISAFVLPLLDETQKGALYHWFWERSPCEPGIFIASTEFSKGGGETSYNIVSFGFYRERPAYPIWGAPSGETLFNWHFSRGFIQVGLICPPVMDFSFSFTPLPKTIYPIYDRVVFPNLHMAFPLSTFYGVNMHLPNVNPAVVDILAALEGVFCDPPIRLPVIELKREDVEFAETVNGFGYPLRFNLLWTTNVNDIRNALAGAGLPSNYIYSPYVTNIPLLIPSDSVELTDLRLIDFLVFTTHAFSAKILGVKP